MQQPSFDIPTSLCPFCGKRIERATDPEFQGLKPQPGNFCVCIQCGRISIFDENVKLRKLTTREGIEMPLGIRHKAEVIKAAIKRNKAKYN